MSFWLAGICLIGGILQLYANPIQWQTRGRGGDSFPESQIESMLQDSVGFMWFGTTQGLFRYDGEQARWFRHDPDSAASLTPGNVRCLLEDKQGQFWVGTNGGLSLLDRESGNITTFQHLSETGPLLSNNVWTLYEDISGQIWIGMDLGLQRLDHGTAYDMSDAYGGVVAFGEDAQGTLWMGSDRGGLYQYQDGHWQISVQLPKARISTLFRDKDNQLWAGTLNSGLWLKANEGWRKMPFVGDTPIRSLTQDGQGLLWVATEGGLLCIDQSLNLIPDIGTNGDVNLTNPKNVYATNDGLIWVATDNPGLALYDKHWDWFENFLNLQGGAWCLSQHGESEIWIGGKSGITALNTKTQEIRRPLSNQTVRSIQVWGEKTLVGTDAGLVLLPDSDKPQFLLQNRVWRILPERGSKFWIGTDRGLVLLDLQDGSEWPYGPDQPPERQLSNRVITSLCRDAIGNLWVGTYGGGLNKIDNQGRVIQQFRNEKENPTSLSADDVVHIALAKSGALWISTLSGGLNRLPSGQSEFERFSASDGLPDNAVAGVWEQSENQVWVYSAAGIVQLDPVQKSYTLYTHDHGVLLGSAIPGSLLHAQGKLWFGGTNGVTALLPEAIQPQTRIPLLFTDLEIGNKHERQFMLPDETLELTTEHKSFALTFRLLDFRPAFPSAVRYQREGIDADWVSGNTVNYTQYLSFGGTGNLHIQAADTYGKWHEATLKLHVATPTWFRFLPLWILLAVGLLSMATYALAHSRHQKRQQKLMEQAQFERKRAELAERQHQLEIQARTLLVENQKILQNYMDQRLNEMANDLHDGPLGKVQGLGFQIHLISKESQETTTRNQLQTVAETQIPSICEGLRNLCGELVSPDFKSGFILELEEHVELMKSLYPNTQFSCHWFAQESVLSSETKATVFRVFRTLLRNVGKHAQAKHVAISMTQDEDQLTLILEDDGIGFEVPEDWDQLKAQKHFGLYLAHTFCKGLGGQLVMDSQPGKGCRATISVPLKAQVS